MATTSKIKTINQVSEPWGDRKILYHQLEMENGNKINIGKMKVQEVGQELTYEIIDEGHEYNRAKSVQKDGGGFKGGYTDTDKMRMAKSVAIKSAAIFFQQRQGDNKEIKEFADFCYEYITDTSANIESNKKMGLPLKQKPFDNKDPF